MKHFVLMTIASAGLATFAVLGEARAQIPIGGPGNLPQPTPVFSPYLNLLRQGASPTLNYYGLVRPELNFMNSVGNLRQQVVNDQQNIDQLQSGYYPITGHPAMFLNTGSYFLSNRTNIGSTSGSNTGLNARGGVFSQNNIMLRGNTGTGSGSGSPPIR